MLTKPQIFNAALGFLLLTRDIKNPDTDQSNEAKTLNLHWPAAWSSALQDMDLDSSMDEVTLELVTTNPNTKWLYAYKYPAKCAFFRRIDSGVLQDNRSTKVLMQIRQYNGQKCIFTNEQSAVGEYISTNLSPASLGPAAGLCVAAKLAELSSALIVGKGAGDVRKAILEKYAMYKAEAQKHDRMENYNYPDPVVESEFVEARVE